MKRFYLIAALLSMTLMANAQLQDTGKSLTERQLYVTPRLFTYEKNIYLNTKTTEGEGQNEKTTFTIYNDEFEKIRSFVVSGYKHIYKYSDRYRKYTDEGIPTEVWIDGSSREFYEGKIVDPYLTDYDEYSGPGEGFFISQTLFNTDEKYEYIRYEYDDNAVEVVYESDRDGDGITDYRTDQLGGKRIGFSIVQEDGTVLQTIKTKNDPIYLWILKFNGKLYLVAQEKAGQTSNGGDILTHSIYRIDQQANSIKQVDMDIDAIKLFPRVANRNEQVTVDLESDAREIQVVNAAGQTMKRIPVSVGQRQVTFNTHGLNSGVNVVRATGRNQQASSKFIVK